MNRSIAAAGRQRADHAGNREPPQLQEQSVQTPSSSGSLPATLLGVTVLGYEQLVEIIAQLERSDSKGK